MIFLFVFFMIPATVSVCRLSRQQKTKELWVLAVMSCIVVGLLSLLILGVDLPCVGTAMNSFFRRMVPFLYKL